MHACSSIIERNLQSIPQAFSSTHPSLFHISSPSRSPSILPQFQLPSIHSNQSLFRRTSTINNSLLNPIEIRLFHTLHYLILYSNDNNNQLLSLNTIQLFIYLFIPYIHTYLRNNEKEFLSNSDLIQGMRLIWQPLFEYHQPNIHIFNAFIKPIILSNDEQEQIFPNQQHRLSILIKSPTETFIADKQPLSHLTNARIKKELKSSTFMATDSDTTTTHDSTSDPETANNKNIKIRAPLVHMNSICSVSVSDLSRLTISPQSPGT